MIIRRLARVGSVVATAARPSRSAAYSMSKSLWNEVSPEIFLVFMLSFRFAEWWHRGHESYGKFLEKRDGPEHGILRSSECRYLD